MSRLLACLGLVLMLAACGGIEGPAPRPMAVALAVPQFDPAAARDAINAYRAKHGLPPLKLNAKLAAAAEAHAKDLSRHDTISHKGSDGSDPWLRITRAGYAPRLAAENVATGQANFTEAMRDWEHSPAHDRNLKLADATEMGIALAYDADTRYQTFWVLDLGTPR
jgi:uncharacterized protein YkwD